MAMSSEHSTALLEYSCVGTATPGLTGMQFGILGAATANLVTSLTITNNEFITLGTYGGYARVNVAWTAWAAGSRTNAAEVLWPTRLAAPAGAVNAHGVCVVATGGVAGRVTYFITFAPVAIAANQQPRMAASSFTPRAQ